MKLNLNVPNVNLPNIVNKKNKNDVLIINPNNLTKLNVNQKQIKQLMSINTNLIEQNKKLDKIINLLNWDKTYTIKKDKSQRKTTIESSLREKPKDKVNGIWGLLGGLLLGAGTILMKKIKDAISFLKTLSFVSLFKNFLSSIKGFFNNIFVYIKSTKIYEKITGFFDDILSFFSRIKANVISAIKNTNVYKKISNVAKEILLFFDGIKNIIIDSSIFKKVQSVFTSFKESFNVIYNSIKENKLIKTIITSSETIFKSLFGGVTNVFNVIKNSISSIKIADIIKSGQGLFSNIISNVKNIFSSITSVFKEGSFAGKIFSFIKGSVFGFVEKLFSPFVPFFKAFKFIFNKIPIISGVFKLFESFSAMMKGDWFKAIERLIRALIDFTMPFLGGTLDLLDLFGWENVFNKIKDLFKWIGGKVWEGISWLGSKLGESFSWLSGKVWEGISWYFDKLSGFWKSIFDFVFNGILNIGTKIFDFFTSGLSVFVSSITSIPLFSNIINVVKDKLMIIYDKFSSTFTWIGDTITNILNKIQSTISSFIPDKIKNMLGMSLDAPYTNKTTTTSTNTTNSIQSNNIGSKDITNFYSGLEKRVKIDNSVKSQLTSVLLSNKENRSQLLKYVKDNNVTVLNNQTLSNFTPFNNFIKETSVSKGTIDKNKTDVNTISNDLINNKDIDNTQKGYKVITDIYKETLDILKSLKDKVSSGFSSPSLSGGSSSFGGSTFNVKGGTKLDKFEQALASNEATGKTKYKISHAIRDASNFSFGGSQFDIGQRPDAWAKLGFSPEEIKQLQSIGKEVRQLGGINKLSSEKMSVVNNAQRKIASKRDVVDMLDKQQSQNLMLNSEKILKKTGLQYDDGGLFALGDLMNQSPAMAQGIGKFVQKNSIKFINADTIKQYRLATRPEYAKRVDNVVKVLSNDSSVSKSTTGNMSINIPSPAISPVPSHEQINMSSVGSSNFKSPVNAPVTSGFGMRLHPLKKVNKFHKGVDYGANEGDKIFASADGKVEMTSNLQGYGLYTSINHGNGITTGYAHQSKFLVKKGDLVKQGQPIGFVGHTGAGTGSHLHFEVYKNGNPIDPMGVVSGKMSIDQQQYSGNPTGLFNSAMSSLGERAGDVLDSIGFDNTGNFLRKLGSLFDDVSPKISSGGDEFDNSIIETSKDISSGKLSGKDNKIATSTKLINQKPSIKSDKKGQEIKNNFDLPVPIKEKTQKITDETKKTVDDIKKVTTPNQDVANKGELKDILVSTTSNMFATDKVQGILSQRTDEKVLQTEKDKSLKNQLIKNKEYNDYINKFKGKKPSDIEQAVGYKYAEERGVGKFSKLNTIYDKDNKKIIPTVVKNATIEENKKIVEETKKEFDTIEEAEEEILQEVATPKTETKGVLSDIINSPMAQNLTSQFVSPVLNNLSGGISSQVNGLTSNIDNSILGMIPPELRQFVPQVSSLNIVSDTISNIIPKDNPLLQNSNDVMNLISNPLGTLINKVNVNDVVKTGSELIGGLGNSIQNSDMVKSIGNTLSNIGNSDVMKNIGNTTSNVLGGIGNSVSGMFKNIQNSDFGKSISGTLNTMGNSISNSGIMQSIKGVSNGIMSKVSDFTGIKSLSSADTSIVNDTLTSIQKSQEDIELSKIPDIQEKNQQNNTVQQNNKSQQTSGSVQLNRNNQSIPVKTPSLPNNTSPSSTPNKKVDLLNSSSFDILFIQSNFLY